MAGGGDSGYEIERSLRFNSGDSAYLSRTPSSAGNRKTWTWSGWVKRTKLSQWTVLFGGAVGSNTDGIFITSDNIIYVALGANHYLAPILRDTSAWYHIVIAVDTTQSTNTDRIKVYINGVLAAVGTAGYPSQNYDTAVNNAVLQTIGRNAGNTGSFGEYYLADVHMVDGQALAATDFGAPDDNGVWQPKKFEGTFGPLVNQTQTWSSNVSGGASSYGAKANAFDGSLSTFASPNPSSPMTYTNPASANAVISTFEIYGRKWSTATAQLNDTDISSQITTTIQWHTITGFTGQNFSKLYWAPTSGGYEMRIFAIRLNGSILVDSGVSLADNSFHLDFADNSSNAALGTDTSGVSPANTWTVNNLTASAPPATTAIDFDGNDKVLFPGTTFSGDCTIECFVKSSNYGGIKRIFSANEGTNSGQYTDLRAYNGAHEFYFGTGSYVTDNGTTMPTNVWNHIALTRSGSTVSYYMNGTRLGTDTYSGSVLCTSMVLAHGYGSEYLTGQISNARIVNGQALYTGASYTVPTEPLTLTSQGATASNVTHLLANTSSVTANGGTGSAGTAGGNPTVVSASVFGAASEQDSLVDSPTNGTQSGTGAGGEVVGNYATLNPLDKRSNVTLSNGNLDVTTTNNHWSGVKGTFGVNSGKYYFEATANGANANYMFFGICASNVVIDPSSYVQDNTTERAKGMLIFCDDGRYQLDANARTNYSSSASNGDVIAVAFDLDGNTVQFYKNGTALGSIDISSSPLASATVVPFFVHYNSSTTYQFNFGQRAFAYTAPSGYKALCTANLPTPTIADGSKYFDTKLYTGNGGTQSVGGFGFSPDFAWIKNRVDGGLAHFLFDSVRGATKALSSNLTSTESTQSDALTSFNNDGFSVGAKHNVNENNNGIVAWAWDAGTSTVTNNDGSITSQVRANPSAGFSIVGFTGTGSNGSIGHGLNAQPGFVIVKNRSSAGNNWIVWVTGFTGPQGLYLNSTTGQISDTGNFTAVPTSSVLNLGSGGQTNGSSNNMIAYCFSPVEGYSAMGSYTGNGSATDGPFVYTGFRPAFIMGKRTDGGSDNWFMNDSSRYGYNDENIRLYPNLTNGEGASSDVNMDILSNGFRLISTNSNSNGSGATYIYYAVAENPFRANGGLAR